MVEVAESPGRIWKETSESETKRSVSRWTCKNKSLTNSLCNLPDVLVISGMNEGALGGLL